jgi:NAD(P)H-dependent flavin oxidoreductase YrpB (nitropropane dioxygenase family)
MSSIDSKGKLNRRTALKLAGIAVGAAVLPRPARASDRRANCLRTRLSSEFGLRVPLASAGMGFVALPDLTAAVSNAGGLGVYGVGNEPPDVVRARIREIEAMTSGVYGVDFIIADSPLGGPFTTQAHIDAVRDARVPIVVFHFDLPLADWVRQLHSVGTTVWMQTGHVDVARQAVARGVDGIVAQGRSAGGHNKNSTIETIRLVKLMRRALPAKIFILASGGISDGKMLVRAIRAGADGGWAGTVFVAATESYANDGYKRRLITAHSDNATILTTRFGPEFPDAPQRVLRNRATTEPLRTTPAVIGRTLLFPGIVDLEYFMPKYSAIVPTRDTTGDLEEMDMPAGSRSIKAVRAVRPAAAIVNDFIEEGRDACDDDDDDYNDDDTSRGD